MREEYERKRRRGRQQRPRRQRRRWNKRQKPKPQNKITFPGACNFQTNRFGTSFKIIRVGFFFVSPFLFFFGPFRWFIRSSTHYRSARLCAPIVWKAFGQFECWGKRWTIKMNRDRAEHVMHSDVVSTCLVRAYCTPVVIAFSFQLIFKCNRPQQQHQLRKNRAEARTTTAYRAASATSNNNKS